LKSVLVTLSRDFGLGKLISADTSFQKGRGDLIESSTGKIIEIEHDWRDFIKHGHNSKKIDILAVGPTSSPIPRESRKKLPRRIIHISKDHVDDWRKRTLRRRRQIAERAKMDAAINLIYQLLREYVEKPLLISESKREMLPEVYLSEELEEIARWAKECLRALPGLEDFMQNFVTGAVKPSDCRRFWAHVYRFAGRLSFFRS
jgi:hypothetical protein